MALSPESAGSRANLLREMSRGHRSHSRASDSDSNDVSVKDWGTQSQQLPALPAFTPEKYSKSHDEYQINTSALRRAFPEFSQHGSSDEDSIEIGRGLGNGSRDPARAFPSEDPSENISLNFGNGEKYTVTGTPPLKPKNLRATQASQNPIAKVAPTARNGSEKENQDPNGKVTSFGSRSSSGHDTVQRKPTTIYHSVEHDESMPLPARPKSQYASAKSTRFTSPLARQPLAETQPTTSRQNVQAGTNGTIDSINSEAAGTYQSYLLPEMPNMTELMTGVRKDATPNAAKSAKSKYRFGTPSSLRNNQKPRSSHNDLKEVSVPADAKALYLSLQLLQEKVQKLEEERDQAVEKADGYELELLRLRSQVEEQAEPQNQDQDKEWTDERSKFEKSVKSLQNRLKQTTKRYMAAEATIRALTSSRSGAQDQLRAAQSASDTLQSDCITLRDELRKVKRHHEELQGKVERREKAVHELAGMAKQLWDTRRALARSSSKRGEKTTTQSKASQTTAQQASAAIGDVVSQQPGANESLKRTRPRSNLDDTLNIEQPSRPASTIQPRGHHSKEQGSTQYFNLEDIERCETYLSFMDGDEVAKLRQVLQEDRARLASEGTIALPRKSSMKDTTRQSSKKHQQVQYESLSDQICQEITGDVTRPSSRASVRSRHSQRVKDDDAIAREVEFEPESTRDFTQQSIRNPRSRPQRTKTTLDLGTHDDNMTSELILPDITITGAALASTVNNKTYNRDAKAPIGTTAIDTKAAIPRPTPVSERPVSPTPSNPDPTLRPSREPGIALSLVIHSLEAEISRLRDQLAKFEDLYQQTDPSLSKRRRKAVWARILKIGEAVERRADQVYALYDVLEGLKQSGLEMKEEEVEVTLAELGVDVKYVKKATNEVKKASQKAQNDDPDGLSLDEDDSDVDEDVWEGFETTGTQQTGIVGAK